MCKNCEYAKVTNHQCGMFYTCKLLDEKSELVDTHSNKRVRLIKCPKDKIVQAMKEVELMRGGKITKNTWKEYKEELKLIKQHIDLKER